MNRICLGNTIAKLRKKAGMTQAELAQKLNVSNKTISKWENGGGYPEITMLPKLSELFGVSIDYLFKDDTSGIAIAGNLVMDIVNMLDKYPEKSMIANIFETVRAVGGCAANTSIDIAKIDSNIFLSVLGKVGNDESGRYLISQIKNHGIDVSGVIVDEQNITASTNVMTDSRTGERTFFYSGGTNSSFDISDIDIDKLNCKIFHIGYILLLDSLDAADDVYGTRMARLLDMVSKKGIKTSIDVVSEDSNRFAEKVIPALKYTDYVIINEVESTRVTGLEPRNADGSISIKNIKKTMEMFFEYGVRETVIIHCSEAGFYLDKKGNFYVSGSLILPDGFIKGTVGAGDAYAAACLYGFYNNYKPQQILEFAAGASACCISESDSISGVKNKSEIEKIISKYPKRVLKEC